MIGTDDKYAYILTALSICKSSQLKQKGRCVPELVNVAKLRFLVERVDRVVNNVELEKLGKAHS